MWEFSGNKCLIDQSRNRLLNQFRYRHCTILNFSVQVHSHTLNEKDQLTNENSLISPSNLASFGRFSGGSWEAFVTSYLWGFSSGNLLVRPKRCTRNHAFNSRARHAGDSVRDFQRFAGQSKHALQVRGTEHTLGRGLLLHGGELGGGQLPARHRNRAKGYLK